MNTQDCEELLKNGWELVQYKNNLSGHKFYLRDPDRNKNRNFRVHYINKAIADNLQKKGYMLITHKIDNVSTEGTTK